MQQRSSKNDGRAPKKSGKGFASRQSPPARESSTNKGTSRNSTTKKNSITSSDLVGFLRNEPACPALLLIVPDFVRRERAAKYVLEHWLGPFSPKTSSDEASTPQISTENSFPTNASAHRYMGSTLNTSNVLALSDSASSLSLFTSKEVSYIRDVDHCLPAVATELARIVPRFGTSHRLLLTAGVMLTSNPLMQVLSEQNACIRFEALKGFELHRWLEKELKRSGFKSWNESALTALLSASEESPDRLAAMTHQLSLFCEGETLSAPDVAALFVHQTTPGEFEFLDALIAGNVPKCEIMISEFFRSGKNQFMILALVARSFSNYLAVRTMLDEGIAPQAIREKLGLSQWVYNKAVNATRRFSADRLTSVMKTLVSIDSRLKNRSVGAEILMSELVRETSLRGEAAEISKWSTHV